MASRTLPDFRLSDHARHRMDERCIGLIAVRTALRWGRRTWSHGDHRYHLGRRAVARARRLGVRIDAHEGVFVILSRDGVVRSVYRNRRPRRRRC
ncbi:MAG: hypothetical protein H6739_08470 [Alphaproteobacteria bacterium]|nr:hypothetical protein [Alphaproteobacteria bacterium]